jgi:peptidoglycan/xylan/chitin deacetylase (PgdA/CDA1 family)
MPVRLVVKTVLMRARSAWWLASTRGRLDGRALRILLYHRVAADGDPLAVTPRRFREQMEYLAAEGFRVIDLAEAMDVLEGDPQDARTIGLTFDDGFADVRDEALPVLVRHGFRATVFVTTGVTDGRTSFAWYDRQPPVLAWDEIAELDRAGTLRFEAHTLSHPNLLDVDDACAAAEIGDCKAELSAHLGRPITLFAYPAGLHGERERRLARQAGYRAAVSCEPGLNDARTDRFALRRRQIDAADTLLDFRAKIGGGHDSPPPLRRSYRRLRYGMRDSAPWRASSRA